MSTSFAEVALLLVMAVGMGLIGTLARQPLIVSFIVVGLIAGPSALDAVHSDEPIELLSELGIAVLLLLVGIKLDVKLIRSLGRVSVMMGLGQIIVTMLLGYLLGLILGLDRITSLYVAAALSFSSTIIIVKLLTDKREIDALHGQMSLGVLIVQDVVVVLAMIGLSAMGVGAHEHRGADSGSVILVLASGLALVTCIVLFARYAADPLTERLSRSPELLVLFAIALSAMCAAIGDAVGLGKEIGGLLAGIALASTPFRESISARLAPLRDFLLLFFFIALGAKLNLSLLGTHLTAAVCFSIFVLIGKPLIVLIITGALGYRKRTGVLTGLTLAQISEFSLIFVAMGVGIGHVTEDALGLVTMVGLVTIAASTYMITFSHRLFGIVEPWLGIFERKGTPREPLNAKARHDPPLQVIIFGLGRFGTAIGLRLKNRCIRVLGIDFNPQAVKRWRDLGLEAEFGDATDPEFVAELPLGGVEWVLSTVPIHPTGLSHEDTRRTLIQLMRAASFHGRVAAASHTSGDTEKLLASGANLVLEPFQDAADRAVDLLCGAATQPRTIIPEIATEGREAS